MLVIFSPSVRLSGPALWRTGYTRRNGQNMRALTSMGSLLLSLNYSVCSEITPAHSDRHRATTPMQRENLSLSLSREREMEFEPRNLNVSSSHDEKPAAYSLLHSSGQQRNSTRLCASGPRLQIALDRTQVGLVGGSPLHTPGHTWTHLHVHESLFTSVKTYHMALTHARAVLSGSLRATPPPFPCWLSILSILTSRPAFVWNRVRFRVSDRLLC
jgi:hypothetical protein